MKAFTRKMATWVVGLACVAGSLSAQAEGRIRIAEQFGVVYLLLNVAEDQQLIEKHAKAGGLLRLLHAVRDRLVPGSRFVTFAGSLGLEPRAHEAGPGAVNAAVFNLMRQISLLYGPRGVTTHTLSPGPADTPRLRRIVAAVAAERGAAEEDVWQEYVAQNSLGRLPTADELAWAVEMLLDPEASILHGSVLYLDAGGHRGIG